MTLTATKNPSTRKTLATQLDRLDGILDGLAEAIPDAVAVSVRVAVAEAVRIAVAEAVTEALSHPDVLARLAPPPVAITPTPVPDAQPPAIAPKPKTTSPTLQRWKGVANQALVRCGELAQHAATTLVALRSRLSSAASTVWACRKPLAIAAGVGLATCVVATVVGPTLAALMCGTSASALFLTAGNRIGGFFRA